MDKETNPTPSPARSFTMIGEYVNWVSRDEGTRMDMDRDIRYASTH
jgi:hypothetical protein